MEGRKTREERLGRKEGRHLRKEIRKGRKVRKGERKGRRDTRKEGKKEENRKGGKSVEILMLSSQCVRWLKGVRISSCKSAKDRTSMLLT